MYHDLVSQSVESYFHNRQIRVERDFASPSLTLTHWFRHGETIRYIQGSVREDCGVKNFAKEIFKMQDTKRSIVESVKFWTGKDLKV